MTLKYAKSLRWGTYGKNQKYEHAVYRTLGTLTKDHLEAILRTQKHIKRELIEGIELILKMESEEYFKKNKEAEELQEDIENFEKRGW